VLGTDDTARKRDTPLGPESTYARSKLAPWERLTRREIGFVLIS
jgi:hypothetical protein